MKKNSVIFGFTMLAFVTTKNTANGWNEGYRVVGDFTCLQVLDESYAEQVFAYLKGFATATNIWLPARKDHFNGMTANELMNWVTTRCRSNSIATLGSSMTSLVVQLTSGD